jgi:hypothetical protein
MTVSVCPAMVSVPVLVAPGLASNVKTTFLLTMPLRLAELK